MRDGALTSYERGSRRRARSSTRSSPNAKTRRRSSSPSNIRKCWHRAPRSRRATRSRARTSRPSRGWTWRQRSISPPPRSTRSTPSSPSARGGRGREERQETVGAADHPILGIRSPAFELLPAGYESWGSPRERPGRGVHAAGPVRAPGTSGLQATSALQAAASALATRNVNIRLIDVGVGGDGPVENVGIVNVYAADDLPASGIPMEIRAAVRNFGATARANVVVNATIDGNRESPQTIETLAAGAVQEVSFATTFRDAGDHTVEIFIDEDKLTVDDRRAFAIAVRPPVRILLVDGSPDPEPEIASAGMIGLALAPPRSRLDLPLPPRHPGAGGPGQVRLPARAPRAGRRGGPRQRRGLLRRPSIAAPRVRGGGGSVVFVLGDRVDPASYASRLRAGRDPKSWLLPGSLMGVREVPTREHPPWRIATIEEPVAPYLRFFDPPSAGSS